MNGVGSSRLRVFALAAAAWPLVLRRALAHWRLLSAVTAGILLASVIMAGTVIYFDALRELALRQALTAHRPAELDILVRADRGPTTPQERAVITGRVEAEVDDTVAWLLQGRLRGVRSATFFVAPPEAPEQAGEDNARSYFVVLPDLEAQIKLLPGGAMPRPGRLEGGEGAPRVEALLPQEAAELFGVGVGDHLLAVPPWSDAVPYIEVVVSGLFVPRDPDATLWWLDQGAFRSAVGSGFRTAPFYVPDETFMGVVGASLKRLNSTYAWLLDVDQGRLRAGDAARALADVRRLRERLSSELFNFRQLTALEEALEGYDRRILFSKLQMFVVLILLAAVVLYYVVTLASIMAEQHRRELALLRGRGASPGQLLGVFVLEGFTLSALAVLLGPLLAALAVGALGTTPVLGELSGGARLPVRLGPAAFGMSALGGLLAFGALLIPAFRASRVEVTEERRESSRPRERPLFQRYYLDVALLGVAIFLFQQLAEQGSVAARDVFGETVVSQVLLAVPALVLVASAVVLLRLFPLAMAVASRLLSRGLPPGLLLGLWQIARSPTHYARLALLLILMSGLGILAASFGATLDRSFRERVLYATGADLRLEGVGLNIRGRSRSLTDTYRRLPEVRAVGATLRSTGQDLSRLVDSGFTLLAVDRREFARVAWFREDFAPRSLEDLMALLEPSGGPRGLPLPDNARSIALLVKADRPHPGVVLVARLRDANGRYITYPLGPLRSSGWLLMEAGIFEGRNVQRQLFPQPPLELVSIAVLQTDPDRELETGALLIDDVRARRASGEVEVIEPFFDASGWSVLHKTPQARPDRARRSQVSTAGDGSLLFTWAGGSPLVSRGVFPGSADPVPVLASRSFLRRTGHQVGDEFEVSVEGNRLPVQVVEVVDYFPTVDTLQEPLLVADLEALVSYANVGTIFGEVRPNEAWLDTDARGPQRKALLETIADGPFSVGRVHDRQAGLASSQADPLVKAGWSALLFMAFAAILVLSGVGFTVHAYTSFVERQLQFALLRTMGLSTAQLVALLLVEQALVVVTGMALGTWIGGQLGAAVLPFLSHDERGLQVLPPFVVGVDWRALAVTYGAMTLVFALVMAGILVAVRRMALGRVLRLGEA